MRSVATALALLLAMGSLVACSELPPAPPAPPIVTLGCTNNQIASAIAIIGWELDVSTEPIESGQPFTRTLGGTAVFAEDFLDSVQDFIQGGIEAVTLFDLRATVHVRSGATGEDVTLTVDPDLYEYQCERTRTRCDPDNDVLGDPPDPRGLRANIDCDPVTADNPCGRIIRVPISEDCEPSGVCADLGKAAQCGTNGFCITGGVRIPLEEKTGQYIADAEGGEVLFGWDDESTGATELQDPNDPNDGTWILPPASYEEQTGPNGLRVRVTARGLTVALECTMGVNCAGPLGSGCIDELSSPTPDSALIALPIQAEAF
jgi:hypothetical protein